jgi:hypothetical protein
MKGAPLPHYTVLALIAYQRSISDLKSSLDQVWDNPVLSAHVLRQHESTVASVHGQADAPAPKGRKRKRHIAPEGSESTPEVIQLQEKLDAVNLRCWGYASPLAYHSSLTFVQINCGVSALYACR